MKGRGSRGSWKVSPLTGMSLLIGIHPPFDTETGDNQGDRDNEPTKEGSPFHPFKCTPRFPICLSFNSQQGPPVSGLSGLSSEPRFPYFLGIAELQLSCTREVAQRLGTGDSRQQVFNAIKCPKRRSLNFQYSSEARPILVYIYLYLSYVIHNFILFNFKSLPKCLPLSCLLSRIFNRISYRFCPNSFPLSFPAFFSLIHQVPFQNRFMDNFTSCYQYLLWQS